MKQNYAYISAPWREPGRGSDCSGIPACSLRGQNPGCQYRVVVARESVLAAGDFVSREKPDTSGKHGPVFCCSCLAKTGASQKIKNN